MIDKAREKLEGLIRLPYPPSEEIVACFGKDKNKELGLDENGITYTARIRLGASEKLSKELLNND